MPDSTIYSETSDSAVGLADAVSGGTTWADFRGAAGTTGNYHSNALASLAFGIYSIYSGGRGANVMAIRRSYFVFDLSEEDETIDSAEVKIYLDFTGAGTGVSTQAILGAATSLVGSTDDYGNVFVPGGGGTTLGAEYSDVVSISTTAGYHTFTMNADALTAINSAVGSGSITIALMNYYYDRRNNAPTFNGDYMKVLVYYSDDTTSPSIDPKIELTYEVAAAVTHNATFFGANF